jgi:signal transduction histidine kinase
VTAEKQTGIDRLQQAGDRQRVKILADFINATSHDLRTPLTQIATGLYLVGKTTDKELRLKKIDEINKQVFSLAQILEQLQAMAVLDNLVDLEFQPAAINHVLTEVIAAVKASADAKKIDLISTLQDDLPNILLDTDKMFLALLNLVNNAIQFTQPGGRISLTTHQQDDQIMIEVTDDGIGIPANIFPHIFERFFKADAARSVPTGGSGLGLSLAHRVVELHHGTLEARSISAMGTVFQISLPLS